MGLLAASTFAIGTTAHAGEPYETDDPIPTALGQWEIHAFVAAERFHGVTEAVSGLDISFGAAKDLEVSISVPYAIQDSDIERREAGLGDIALGLKYLFARETEEGQGISLAFQPTITLPTGEPAFTANTVAAAFPLWAQKDIGPWSLFGGGGYTINPGAGNKDFWSGGLAVTRDIAPRLNLGVEGYFQSRSETDGTFLVGFDIGLHHALSEQWALLAAGGPILNNRRENGKYHFYLALAFYS